MRRCTGKSLLAGFLFAAAAGLAGFASAAAGGDPGKPVVFAGKLAVSVVDDFQHGKAGRRYFLEETNLETRFELKLLASQAGRLEPGANIQVKGRLSGFLLTADTTADAVTVLSGPAAAAPVTARKGLVLLLDITDGNGVKHAVSASCDGSTAQDAAIMFGYNSTAGNVDGCYQDSSFGKMGWGGSAYPGGPLDVVRVNVSDGTLNLSATCNEFTWGSDADTAATKAGVTLSNYQHRIYVLPPDVGCSWAGEAYVSCGNSCQAWVKAYSGQPCGYNDTFAHELGHNVGMEHASTDSNNDGAIDCEYCDDSDFMGYSEANLRTQNGPHKVEMAWISGGGVVDGGAGGVFTIAPLEQAGAAIPQVVRITPGAGLPYYLSYRVATGYDSSIPQPSLYANKTNIHRYAGGNTLFVGAVGDGESFNDSKNGLTVTQNSHTSSSATFTVSTTCSPLSPAVSLSPSTQGTNTVPAAKSYTVTVTNRDSVACAATLFALSGSAPAGWTKAVTPGSLSLAPGASATATLSATAPAGTVDGNYSVGASTAADGNHASASASATFSVDTTKPTAPSSLTATASKGSKVLLKWTASSDTGSGIAFYRIYRNGVALSATPSTTSYTDAPGNGTWTYTVRAQDKAGNLSDASNSASIKVGRK
jgi:hypothetical protein